METRNHVFKSLEHIRYNEPEFYFANQCKIVRLMHKLHRWLDYFAGKPGYRDTNEERKVKYHKEQRHHCEGRDEAVEKFTAMFGEEFRIMIFMEAYIHISDDFCGDFPAKSRCTRIYIRTKQRELEKGCIG